LKPASTGCPGAPTSQSGCLAASCDRQVEVLHRVAAAALHEGVRQDRDLDAEPLTILTHPTDFAEWARGAAVTAIQAFVLGDARPGASLDGAARQSPRRAISASETSARA